MFDKHIKIDELEKIVDDIFSAWDINSRVSDKGVIEDIKSAITEGYIIGALHGGLDKTTFDAAVIFANNYGIL